MQKRSARFFLVAPALALVWVTALAQQYPTKPIRVVVGGSPDAVPRILGPKLTESWGQQVIVDQRGGGGGTIAAEIVARAPADGHTLLLSTATHMMSVNFYKVSYNMARDFAPVTQLAYTTFVLSVHPSLPARSVKELMNYEKSGKFTRREKIALRYADAILYDPAQADDKLWADLHAEFNEPELVELGYWVGFTFGGQRWLKTLSTKQGEFAAFLEKKNKSKAQMNADARR